MNSRGIGLPLGGTEVKADDGKAVPMTIAVAATKAAKSEAIRADWFLFMF